MFSRRLSCLSLRAARYVAPRVDPQCALRDSGVPVGRAVRLRVLARDVSLTTEEPRHTSIQNHLPCTIESSAPDVHPSQVLVRVRVGASTLVARITGRSFDALGLQPGKSAWLQVKSVALLE